VKSQSLWERFKRGARDQSFIVGSVLVLAFVLIAVFGPELAPHNPYLRDRVQTIDGELQRAPIEPGSLYPLGTDEQGRDMLSMLLHGARQTLVIASMAVLVRLFLGFVLGTLSGWWPNSWLDRACTTVTEFLAAIPALILAILLVFAVGVRRGQVAFLVALSLVGWGEVAQIVRGHVLTLRNRLFVLASRAIGLSPLQILSRHVLPNLLSTLLALAALEMGSVLLLLGELGFLNIFIGGGGLYTDDAVGAIHYFDVPDWGAMLGVSWRYFRRYPWLPMAPAAAFFVAILGFNLFGYGLQRFIEKGRFHPSGWSLLRLALVIALLFLGMRALLRHSGTEAQFVDLAREFSLQRAWNDVGYLTQAELAGRPPGPDGGFQAAGYIAHQFEQAGLTPLQSGDYFQFYKTYHGRVTQEPVLEVLDSGARFDQAITFDPRQCFSAQGSREGRLTIVGNTRERVVANGFFMLLDPDDDLYAPYNYRVPENTVALRVVADDAVWRRDLPPRFSHAFGAAFSYPHLLIGESAAARLLAERGLDLKELRARMEAGEPIRLETDIPLRLQIGLTYEETPAVNVVGYIPAADQRTEGDRILLAVSYTASQSNEDAIYPGADENASGVAVMLETARLWHDLGFEPKRTVVFAALDENGGSHFVQSPVMPASKVSDTWITVIVHGVGAGESRLARAGMGVGLARAFDDSARRLGARTKALDEWPFFFLDRSGRYASADKSYSGLAIVRPGDTLSGTPADTIAHLDQASLLESGQVVAHYLMVLSAR